jgi:hypothetical protein
LFRADRFRLNLFEEAQKAVQHILRALSAARWLLRGFQLWCLVIMTEAVLLNVFDKPVYHTPRLQHGFKLTGDLEKLVEERCVFGKSVQKLNLE